MSLLNLETVKDRLGFSEPDSDPNLYSAMEQAEKIVIDYLEVEDNAYDTTLPKHIEAAMMLVVRNLIDAPADDPISEGVKSLLMRTRVPTAI